MTLPRRCPVPAVDLPADLPARIDTHPWAARAVEGLSQVHRTHVDCAPSAPPVGETDWFHLYVCPESNARLEFDPTSPHEHRSPVTGKALTGSPYDECWRAVMHGAWTAALERAALLDRAGVGGGELRPWMRGVLMHWATHWATGRIKPRAGKGRLMPQGLTEAIFQASICQTLQWLPDLLSEDDWQTLRDEMLAPAADLLRPQWAGADSGESQWADEIHNIACWLNAAKYGLGWALGDDELKRLAVDGPVGWRAQLERGIHDDGWWYEKTLTYQTYSLNALLTLAMLARSDGLDLLGEAKLASMATALLRVVRDDGSLPSWNDGWRGHELKAMLNPLEILAGAGNDEIAGGLAWLYETFPRCRSGMAWVCLPGANTWVEGGRPARGGVATLAWGCDELPAPAEPKRDFVFFPDSGIAILKRGAVHLSLRSGPYGGGHDHRDRTDVAVRLRDEPIAEDMGTPPYGSDLVGTWFRQPASHRLVMVERTGQMPTDGRIVEASPTRAVAEAPEAYVNAGLHREVTLDDDGLGWTDRTTVRTDGSLRLDWIFHLRGRRVFPKELEAEQTPADWQGGGLEHITDLHRLEMDQGEASPAFGVRWATAAGELELLLRVENLSSPVARMGICPDNPSDQSLSAIVLTGQSTDAPAAFTATWRLV